MAELVDALVSEASEETHGGSSPLGHTRKIANPFSLFSGKDFLIFGAKLFVCMRKRV